MKIYLASPFEKQPFMRVVRGHLQERGYEVTADWLDEKTETGQDAALAQRDIAAIQAADVVVVYNPQEFRYSGTGGRHVELGIALMLDKVVVLLGERSNVFHHLVLHRVETTVELYRLLDHLRLPRTTVLATAAHDFLTHLE